MKKFTVTFLVKGYEASNSMTIAAKDKANAEEIVRSTLRIMHKLKAGIVKILNVEESR